MTKSVPWSSKDCSKKSGIYIASLQKSPDSSAGHATPQFALQDLDHWLQRCPDLNIGESRPTPSQLADELGRWWLQDESIIYIGQTSAKNGLRGRLSEFYRTRLGDSGPHRGGIWIKTLALMSNCWVHYCEHENPRGLETQLLLSFAKNISLATALNWPDPDRIGPFGNLEVRTPEGRKARRKHPIFKSTA